MKEYQVEILRLQGSVRDDEEMLTDLLNERARTGWTYQSAASLSATRLMVVFARDTS